MYQEAVCAIFPVKFVFQFTDGTLLIWRFMKTNWSLAKSAKKTPLLKECIPADENSLKRKEHSVRKTHFPYVIKVS